MPNIGTKEEQQLYEMLQDLWGRIESVDDVFDEVSGYMNGLRSAQSEVAALRKALDEIANPVKYMEAALAPDERLCGQTAVSLSSDPQYLKEIASRALAAHDKEETGEK